MIEYVSKDQQTIRWPDRRQIEKKVLPEFFKGIASHKKMFELRKDEDGIRPGDILVLREWNGKEYTGRRTKREVTAVLRDCPEYGLMEGYCILSLQVPGWDHVSPAEQKPEREAPGRKGEKYEKDCKLCRYCLADPMEVPHKGFYCVNEDSPRFGQIVSEHGGDGPWCEGYDKVEYGKMSLKEALQIMTLPPMEGATMSWHSNYGREGDGYVWAAHFFRTNKDLERYREAHIRCFDEYMRLAKEDGDFDEG